MRRALAALLLLLTIAPVVAIHSDMDRSITGILASEGSEYTNDPRDPGGPTKFGVTLTDVRLYVKRTATAADVKALTRDTAIRIYQEKYWDALRGDDLPAGVDYSTVDYGVNSGIVRSGKVLRAALGLPSADWHVTDAVIAKARTADPGKLIHAINDERLAFLKRLSTWQYFGGGWGRRVTSVTNISLDMAGLRPAHLLGEPPPTAAFGPHKAWGFEGINDQIELEVQP